MNKKTRSTALSIIILAGIAALIYVWVSYGFTPNANEAPKISSKISGRISLNAAVVAEKSADLGFILPAKIISLPKKVGDTVKAGEVLAVQDGADIKAQVGAAQAGVASAQAQLDALNHDLKKEKLKVHDVSGNAKKVQQAQVSSSEDSVQVQENALVAAQDNLKNAQAQLAKTVLLAPFDGIIARQDAQIGEIGSASSLPFLTLNSNEPLQKIEALASDLDVASIKIGDQAQVAVDIFGGQKTVAAQVVSVDPATYANANQGKSVYKVTLRLNEADASLRAGMHASVTF